jgi:hypothetical protein
MLCAVSSKKTLLGLWADLKAASKTQFESELAKAQETIAKATADADTPAPPARSPRSRGLRSATPAARIVHRLTEEVGLSEREAISALTAGLREKGVDAAKIPSGSENLTQWVEALLERVSGAVVMGAAQRIEKP